MKKKKDLIAKRDSAIEIERPHRTETPARVGQQPRGTFSYSSKGETNALGGGGESNIRKKERRENWLHGGVVGLLKVLKAMLNYLFCIKLKQCIVQYDI